MDETDAAETDPTAESRRLNDVVASRSATEPGDARAAFEDRTGIDADAAATLAELGTEELEGLPRIDPRTAAILGDVAEIEAADLDGAAARHLRDVDEETVDAAVEHARERGLVGEVDGETTGDERTPEV